MKKPDPSAPRHEKSGKAAAPAPKPFNEREQLAIAKALRSKKKPPVEPESMPNDED